MHGEYSIILKESISINREAFSVKRLKGSVNYILRKMIQLLQNIPLSVCLISDCKMLDDQNL